jgi:hypothetical protein
VLLAQSATLILPKKFPGRSAIFSLELVILDLVIQLCGDVCLRRVSRSPFVGYFGPEGRLNSLGVSFRMSAA